MQPKSLAHDLWSQFQRGVGSDFSIVTYNVDGEAPSDPVAYPIFEVKIVDIVTGAIVNLKDSYSFRHQNESSSRFETLRLDWSSRSQTAFFSSHWTKFLNRTDEEITRLRTVVESATFKIEVVFVFLDCTREPKKISVEFASVPGICQQLAELTGVSHDHMVVAVVSIDGVFQRALRKCGLDCFEYIRDGNWLVVYEVVKPERGRLPSFLPVNMFNSESRQHFGTPLLIQTPHGRTSYEALRDSLKLQLYRYGRCLSPCESWPSLENWWSRQNVGLAPEVGSSTEARVEVTFAVHKSILTARSEVFEAMLNGSNNLESTTNRLVIKDATPEVLKEFLRFLYTDQVESFEKYAIELAIIANKYFVGGLKTKSEKCLVKSLGTVHAIKLLVFASCYEMNDLKEKCLEIIVRNFRRIINLAEWDSFVRTQPDLMVTICRRLADSSLS